MPSIEEVAEQARKHFHLVKRGDKEIWSFDQETTPEWVVDMTRTAHGGMLPDDYKYEFIVSALDYLAEGNDPDDFTAEADPYTHDLLDWLASRNDRAAYVDDTIESYGAHSEQGIIGDITIGQQAEREEVYQSVLSSLREREDVEDEESD